MTASVPVMAQDLYLVRFASGKEVVFELTARHARLVENAKWEEEKEVLQPLEHATLGNFTAADVGIGAAKWITVKEPVSSSPSDTKSPRFVLLPNGTVYDRFESRVLVLSCRGTIKAVMSRESEQELVVVNRVVTHYYHNSEGKFMGAGFTGDDELTFIRYTGEVVRRIPIEGLGILFLNGEDTSLIPVVQSVSSTHWVNPLNWLRTLAGHPKQSQRVVVSLFNSSGEEIESLHLTDAQDPESFKIFKITR